MSIILTVLIFLLTLIILVAVHEYGHFSVARFFGVKVLRFAIGMGRPFLKIVGKKDKTEYALCPIPLGGYVKMLGEDPQEKINKKDKNRSFSHKNVYIRMAIVAAGPIANFILAIFALWLMYFIGISGVKPIVGQVEKDSIADIAKIQENDTITAVDDVVVSSWSSTQLMILERILENDKIKIKTLNQEGEVITKILTIKDKTKITKSQNILKQLGISAWMPKIKARIGQVQENSPAAIGGLQEEDLVIQINEKKIILWQDMSAIIASNPGRELSFVVKRNKEIINLNITPKLHKEEDRIMGRIGVSMAPIEDDISHMRTKEKFDATTSLYKSFTKAYQLTSLTFKMIGRLIIGEADIKNISGPITIAVYAKQSFSMGFDHFLFFMGLISLSLAILNLLPIPVLDGGHLFFYIIEAIKGSAVSEKTQLLGQKIGIILLGCLMILAFYNDIVRL
jgi:regulator of sigma E protease